MSGELVFPAHRASLTLIHNQHRDYYQPLREWIAENDWCDWEDEAAKERAIAADECWSIQWYPDTPVGFYAVAAPTLEEVLRLANKP